MKEILEFFRGILERINHNESKIYSELLQLRKEIKMTLDQINSKVSGLQTTAQAIQTAIGSIQGPVDLTALGTALDGLQTNLNAVLAALNALAQPPAPAPTA